MLAFLRRLLYILSNRILRKKPEDSLNEKYRADFTKSENTPFDIKSESSYNSYLSNGSLVLCLKKTNCIAWLETPEHEYRDFVLEAKIRLDSPGYYTASGFLFRIADEGSYYIALVSNKGYFRLDVVKDYIPKPLIAWTEVPDFDKVNIDLKIIFNGDKVLIIINEKWAGEAADDSIFNGRLGYALASYDALDIPESTEAANQFICRAWLDFFSIDAHEKTVEINYKTWFENTLINPESRFYLAETFAVMDEAALSLDQLNKIWKQREINNPGNSTEIKTGRELLLAARMSFRLEQYREAGEYIDAALEQELDSELKSCVKAEKARIMFELENYSELKEYMLKHTCIINKDINMYNLLARCHWKLNEYEEAASVWKKAFETEKENGIYAVNAANALELAGKKEDALELFLEAGKIFLRQDNRDELAALIPKLVVLGENNHEARALAGKWAFSTEDYSQSETEFAAAEKIRCSLNPIPEADPAVHYLRGLIFYLNGKNKEAVNCLEEAVKLAPDYGLFRFKLTEFKLASGKKSKKYAGEMRLALEQMDDPQSDMWEYAGNLLANSGDHESAVYFFDKAKEIQEAVSQ
jgi:tetratricopeptide (TPR) repeat protein